MKILVVEDDPTAALVVEAVVSSLGHEVTVATDGTHALAIQQKQPFRVIVSDWQMPGGGGLELCRRVRSAAGDYVYFILLTQQQANDDNELEAMEAGVDDFLTKPVRPREMRLRLHVAERILGYTQQVRQLESFLPICMYCKKIRDDKDYWEQIEGYLAKRTGSRFSHGICPDCFEKVVSPELDRIEADRSKVIRPLRPPS